MGLWQTNVAAQSGDAKAAAEALFVEGRSLAEQQRYEEACEKFEASQRLDAGLGTMLNLADCYEKVGKTASAWATFREAVAVARAAGATERQDLAQTRAEALEGRLSTVSIIVGDSQPPGLEVRRDGLSIDRAAWSTPIPVDPGAHEITAQAPGYQAFQTTVEVGQEADHQEVQVPPLDKAGDAASSEPVMVADSSTSARPGSVQRTWGWATGGVGVAGLGVGAAFGIIAAKQWSHAKGQCGDYPYDCPTDAVDQQSSARRSATVSTVAFIVGAVGVTTGTILLLTAPRGRASTTEVGIGLGSISVKGVF